MKVTGIWKGTNPASDPIMEKPILVGKKFGEIEGDHRVGYQKSPFSYFNATDFCLLKG